MNHGTRKYDRAGALRALYNLLWYPALPIALLAAGGRDAEVRRQRMGVTAPAAASGRKPRIWLHAASVGEIEGVRPLAAALLSALPDADLLITTMTEAGREAARRRMAGARACTLGPLDFRAGVRSFLEATRPQLVLIAETELWPNYFAESRRLGAKIAIVNGRLSERSLRHYRWMRALFAETLKQADLILAQTRTDAARFAALGGPEERIVVAGNLKLDLDGAPGALSPGIDAFASGRRILIAGSTAPGEEAMVADAYAALRERFADLALVLAPRHPERAEEVAELLKSRYPAYVRASAIAPDAAVGEAAVLLLDTMGELRALYARAAVAFVGGSLVRGRGGQNLAEPAAAEVPVLFGPFHQNQAEVAAALVATGGGRVVRDTAELAAATAELLGDEVRRLEMGRKARAALAPLAGGVARSLPYLLALIRLD